MPSKSKSVQAPSSIMMIRPHHFRTNGETAAIYPMYAKNRRLERRWDIIELLKQRYRVQDVIDYSGLEPDRLCNRI